MLRVLPLDLWTQRRKFGQRRNTVIKLDCVKDQGSPSKLFTSTVDARREARAGECSHDGGDLDDFVTTNTNGMTVE
jgi:hypothetical protein